MGACSRQGREGSDPDGGRPPPVWPLPCPPAPLHPRAVLLPSLTTTVCPSPRPAPPAAGPSSRLCSAGTENSVYLLDPSIDHLSFQCLQLTWAVMDAEGELGFMTTIGHLIKTWGYEDKDVEAQAQPRTAGDGRALATAQLDPSPTRKPHPGAGAAWSVARSPSRSVSLASAVRSHPGSTAEVLEQTP
ncbi:hypothetical protein J1605_003399 [Eschrichtius robustus]|uniref:Uncharacterized protein n=1 Tax=Eschrichtius robustus TaxID=9764 RepID=A0AB34HRA3_ESCRO|nr:hypothetical protein J1605_003399 [Eschrichtius robustus]